MPIQGPCEGRDRVPKYLAKATVYTTPEDFTYGKDDNLWYLWIFHTVVQYTLIPFNYLHFVLPFKIQKWHLILLTLKTSAFLLFLLLSAFSHTTSFTSFLHFYFYSLLSFPMRFSTKLFPSFFSSSSAFFLCLFYLSPLSYCSFLS